MDIFKAMSESALDQMSTCPKCGEKIDHLDYLEKVTQYGQYYGRDGFEINDSESEDFEFFCPNPECNAVLFTNVMDAEDFLEGADREVDDDKG